MNRDIYPGSGFDESSPLWDTKGDGAYDQQALAISALIRERQAGIPQDAVTSRQAPIGDVLDAARLTPFSQVAMPDMTPDELRRVPTAVANPGLYGDMTSLLCPLDGVNDYFALARPKATRIFLYIQNNGVGTLYIDFDKAAGLQSMAIAAGGSLFMDNVVPQNDVHLYAAAAVNIPVFYINTNPINATF